MTINLFDRVRLAREGGAVERCHAHPHTGSYTVGQHSLDLVTLITLAWANDHDGQMPRGELLVAAAFHDVPERITGDLPQPVKVAAGPAIERADTAVLDWLKVNVLLSWEEQQYLTFGDQLELWFWCWEQAGRGYNQFYSWIRSYNDNWVGKKIPPGYRMLINQIMAIQDFPRLIDNELMEIAGL
jgi:hypothetical protein